MSDPTNFNDEEPLADTGHEDELISKSELKRQSAQRQKLGEELVKLTAAHLKTIPLDEELAIAIELARNINRKKDGFRRQLQFIGKLMRKTDIAPIEAALSKLTQQHQAHNAAFHQLEKAREQIITQGDEAIQSLVEQYPQLERQKLRQFHRSIKKEREKNAPPKAYRELFQYLKSTLEP
jgi:ribosome-associated protein